MTYVYHTTTGKQDAADATVETVKTIEHPIGKQTEVLLEVLAYAGMYHQNVIYIRDMYLIVHLSRYWQCSQGSNHASSLQRSHQ